MQIYTIIEYNSLYLHYKIISKNETEAYACNRIQPNLETLQQIAEILQVDLKDLITDKKERLQ